ncbi:MAG: ABC transporter ATP-binding protein [Bacillota bacterium]
MVRLEEPGAPVAYLEVKGLSKNFGGVVALKSVTFGVEQGEIFGLIGPNGAGKTTVFNLITGFYRASSGSILLKGHELTKVNAADIVRLGVARTFQNIRLFSNLSVLENVKAACHMKTKYGLGAALLRLPRVVSNEREITEFAMRQLERVGLQGRWADRASSLPYGLQRKLEIARALALEPDLLLLDEPAAGMNPDESLELVDLIRRIHEESGLTVILIEHHMDVVMNLCKRILVLNFGEPLAQGTPGEIQADPRVIKAYLGEEFARAGGR